MSGHRVYVVSQIADPRADEITAKATSWGVIGSLDKVVIADAYTIDHRLDAEQLQRIATSLSNPVSQTAWVDDDLAVPLSDHILQIGFHPGVTDNIGTTARETIGDSLGVTLEGQGVYTSKVMFLSGSLSQDDVRRIGTSIGNETIHKITVHSTGATGGPAFVPLPIPRVRISGTPNADLVDILDAGEDELVKIGKAGIANTDGTRRGQLALDLKYMKTIQSHFRGLGRNPRDIELESIAQTWSEHCKHTIFADPIDDIKDGLYRTFIKGATERIRREKGILDICASVFTDNSGAIRFNDDYLFAIKVETHNSPSLLDPFGGAITGIVGVNRDAIGFGMGALPIFNMYGFCTGHPDDQSVYFRKGDLTDKILSSRYIQEGVISGVNAGGNQSGIATLLGFLNIDPDGRNRGKPLVFAGTGSLIPSMVNGSPSIEKKAQSGDYIVMVGGRVGLDGIHGATFSSVALDSGSPATAVQIGDPITQKKLSDALIKEARDRGLYRSITDNGAGGLSCSVAEMARESGGCHVELEKVPLKYQGLAPWQIWISESQERMTLAVPPDKWLEFLSLMSRRGVEATRIGTFTDSGSCVVDYNGSNIMDLELSFLHDGMPARPMPTTFTRGVHDEPPRMTIDDVAEVFACKDRGSRQDSFESIPATRTGANLTGSLHAMLSRPNIASTSFISQQYDHSVQGGTVIGPLQGRGQVNGDVAVMRPLLDSMRGVMISQGINPTYSDIDTYDMAACAIDTAIRNLVCAGAELDTIHLLDNFCWCSSNDSERLGQLVRAARACYDIAVAHKTPYISGKDSMFNDFKGFDEEGKPVLISIPPTLLITSVGLIDDSSTCVSLDAKIPGDLVYVIGDTAIEMGGSEYFAALGQEMRGKRFIGNEVPVVNPKINTKTYRRLSTAIHSGLVASAQSVHRGGLGIALSRTAMGGRLGMDVNLEGLAPHYVAPDHLLYSESQGRAVVTINPAHQQRFETAMRGTFFTKVGTVCADTTFVVKDATGRPIIDTTIDSMLASYRSTFEGF